MWSYSRVLTELSIKCKYLKCNYNCVLILSTACLKKKINKPVPLSAICDFFFFPPSSMERNSTESYDLVNALLLLIIFPTVREATFVQWQTKLLILMTSMSTVGPDSQNQLETGESIWQYPRNKVRLRLQMYFECTSYIKILFFSWISVLCIMCFFL